MVMGDIWLYIFFLGHLCLLVTCYDEKIGRYLEENPPSDSGRSLFPNGESFVPLREPIIFEPRPEISASGGTYDMMFVYVLDHVDSTVEQAMTVLGDVRNHHIYFVHEWNNSTASEDGLGQFSYSPDNLVNRTTKYTSLGDDVTKVKLVYSEKQRILHGANEKLNRVYARADKIQNKVHVIKEGLRLHASNMSADAHPVSSQNPYVINGDKSTHNPRKTEPEIFKTHSYQSQWKKPEFRLYDKPTLDRAYHYTPLDGLNDPSRPELRQLDREITDDILGYCRERGMSCHVEKPKTRKKRIKRFIPAINFLGVIVNGIRLDKLGSKVDLLLRNQVLQEDKINHVANYLNRTMVKVATMGRNQVEIISYIKHIGETMTKMAKEHTNHEFFANSYHMLLNEIDTLHEILDRCEEEIDKMEKVMRTVQTHALTPDLIDPISLHDYLQSIEESLKSGGKYKLPGNFREDIWSFYSLLRVKPIMSDTSVILVVTIPLLDKTTNLDIYKVHVLPAIHVEGGVMVEYLLEGSYFGVTKDGNYIVVPPDYTMQYCESSRQQVCHLVAPLIPRDNCHLCICALFDDIQNDQTERIHKYCNVHVSPNQVSKAVNLGGNLWAVVPAKESILWKNCKGEPERIKLTPPVTFVDLSDGCYAVSNDLYLTPQPHIAKVAAVIDRWNFMDEFAEAISSYADLRLWKYISPDTSNLDKLLSWKAEDLPDLPAELPIGRLNEQIETFDNSTFRKLGIYFWWIIIGGSILTILLGAAVLYLVGSKYQWGRSLMNILPGKKMNLYERYCKYVARKEKKANKTEDPEDMNEFVYIGSNDTDASRKKHVRFSHVNESHVNVHGGNVSSVKNSSQKRDYIKIAREKIVRERDA